MTTAGDLETARQRILAGRGVRERSILPRVGTGYDLHRLVVGRPLALGGVTVPSDRGAPGPSDADDVCHTSTDAILRAASLRRHRLPFPDTHPPLTATEHPTA